jgi:hypothetical protein
VTKWDGLRSIKLKRDGLRSMKLKKGSQQHMGNFNIEAS